MTRTLYADPTTGGVVEVDEMGADRVSFCNQGGGFVQSMPRAEFDKVFSILDADAFEFRAATVTAEFLDGPPIPCFSTGERWNGFGKPYFRFADVLAINEQAPDFELTYDKDRDAFVAPMHDDEDEVYSAHQIVVGGVVEKVYPVGAGSWVWDSCRFLDDTDAHRFALIAKGKSAPEISALVATMGGSDAPAERAEAARFQFGDGSVAVVGETGEVSVAADQVAAPSPAPRVKG